MRITLSISPFLAQTIWPVLANLWPEARVERVWDNAQHTLCLPARFLNREIHPAPGCEWLQLLDNEGLAVIAFHDQNADGESHIHVYPAYAAVLKTAFDEWQAVLERVAQDKVMAETLMDTVLRAAAQRFATSDNPTLN